MRGRRAEASRPGRTLTRPSGQAPKSETAPAGRPRTPDGRGRGRGSSRSRSSIGHEIGHRQVTDDPVLDILVGRLAQQVAGHQLARVDPRLVQERDQVVLGVRRPGADGDRKPEPRRPCPGRLVGQDQVLGPRTERRAQEGMVGAPPLDEVGQPGQLHLADRRLHVGGLEVVPQVRVDELVVVPVGQRPELLAEALAARVLAAGLAPAVAAPVADRLHDLLQLGPVGEHSAALAQRDLVGRVERQRGELAPPAHVSVAEGGPEGVAAVLHQEQVVPAAELADRRQVERVSERVGDHHRAGAVGHRRFERIDVDVVGGQRDVHEHRHQVVLDDRVDGGREARRDGDHLVPRPQPAVAQLGRAERRQREQVGGRPRVHQQCVAMPRDLAQTALEHRGLRPCGEPEVQAGANQFDHLLGAEHPPGCGDPWACGVEGGPGMARGGMPLNEFEDVAGGGL